MVDDLYGFARGEGGVGVTSTSPHQGFGNSQVSAKNPFEDSQPGLAFQGGGNNFPTKGMQRSEVDETTFVEIFRERERTVLLFGYSA
jgi:hypothetical protein